jgi:hypothetical protein
LTTRGGGKNEKHKKYFTPSSMWVHQASFWLCSHSTIAVWGVTLKIAKADATHSNFESAYSIARYIYI